MPFMLLGMVVLEKVLRVLEVSGVLVDDLLTSLLNALSHGVTTFSQVIFPTFQAVDHATQHFCHTAADALGKSLKEARTFLCPWFCKVFLAFIDGFHLF